MLDNLNPQTKIENFKFIFTFTARTAAFCKSTISNTSAGGITASCVN